MLDIGTAEGSNFLRFVRSIKKGIGVDIEPAMIRLANRNKAQARAKNIIFKVMSSNHLVFPKNTFDIVVAKHAPINFREAFRVLKLGGFLITQQVYESDKANLKRAFRRGQGYGKKDGTLLRSYKKQALKAGFTHIRARLSNVPYYFRSKERLIAFLNKTPTIPNFASKRDYTILERFVKKNKTMRGIKSNTSRFLLELKK